jgi:hypothetical protein
MFVFSTPELISNLWQLKTAVSLHWCLIRALPFRLRVNDEEEIFDRIRHLESLWHLPMPAAATSALSALGSNLDDAEKLNL